MLIAMPHYGRWPKKAACVIITAQACVQTVKYSGVSRAQLFAVTAPKPKQSKLLKTSGSSKDSLGDVHGTRFLTSQSGLHSLEGEWSQPHLTCLHVIVHICV